MGLVMTGDAVLQPLKLARLAGVTVVMLFAAAICVGNAIAQPTAATASADLAEATRLSVQAGALHDSGRYAEAEPLYRRALERRERTLGREHPDTLRSVNNLAINYLDQGRYSEAEPLLRRALESNERTLGREHPVTLLSVNNLAVVYQSQGRDAEAEPLLRRALETRERTLGREHPDTLFSVNNLALI
jgi:tetratricopeptide (TPR) repeat protein